MKAAKTFWMAGSIVAAVASAAAADALYIGEPGHGTLPITDVKINGVDGKDVLSYSADSGPMAGKSLTQPMAKLQRINVDGESTFNSGEDAYAKQDFDSALSSYQAVIQGSAKDWIKSRSATRLMALAKKKNRFDAEVAAFVVLVKNSPAGSAANKPSTPAASTPGLDAAVTSLNTGLGDAQLSAAQKSALLGELLEIYRAKKDTAQTTETLKKLSALGATTPAETAMLKLANAAVLSDGGKYADAIAMIDQNKQLFTEPDQQVDALYILAQANDGLAGASPDAEKSKDVALAFMRVVTFGGQLPDKPHVAESLYRIGQIEEALKEPRLALPLYQQVVADHAFANRPVYAPAKSAADRLAKGTGGK